MLVLPYFFSWLLLRKVLGIFNLYLSKAPTHSAQNLKLYYLLCSDVKHDYDDLYKLNNNNYKTDNINYYCYSPRQVKSKFSTIVFTWTKYTTIMLFFLGGAYTHTGNNPV